MHVKSLAGRFLVASRHLSDLNFSRTVLLMIHHGEEGAMGVVLNRTSEKTVREVWDMVGNDPFSRDDLIYLGGPVPGPLVAVHTLEPFSEQEVLPGVHVSTHRDALDLIVRNSEQPFRIFSGHAGWGGGQLDDELEVGGWLSSQATSEEVFSDDDSLWEKVTQRIGREIMIPDIPKKQLPDDPSMN
jgi:putative transcriptional regulator